MLVGIDIGTQSLKAVVTSPNLDALGIASRNYSPSFPAADRAEQDPRMWENALGPAIAEAITAAGARPGQVTALAVCGQLDGCIPVADDGEALGNCLIWMDRRAQDEFDGVSISELHARTGIVADASHLAAKIRWLKRHDPQSHATQKYHQPVSYMVERLTGETIIDHALASTSMVYNLVGRKYDAELLSQFEISEDELPPITEASDRAGRLNAHGAALTGLPSGIPVAVGTGDDFSTPLGAGIHGTETISVAVGTGEVVGCLFPDPVIDLGLLVETHAYPGGGFFIENPGWLSGGAVKWMMDVLQVSDWQGFDTLATAAPSGSDGLIFIPALTGAMSPEWIPAARGCFYGMTPAHGRAHLARAVLEGCSFAMRDVIDRLRQLGAKTSSLALLAGGSRSQLWGQIRCDLMGFPVTLPHYTHTSALGAAMLAGVAGGTFPNLSAAAACLRPPAQTLMPDEGASAGLESSYQKYRHLFASLKPLFQSNS